jgi:hypothetical protein
VTLSPEREQGLCHSQGSTPPVTGKSRELFGNDAAILSLALSPDGRWLVCGDLMGRVWIFEWVK